MHSQIISWFWNASLQGYAELTRHEASIKQEIIDLKQS